MKTLTHLLLAVVLLLGCARSAFAQIVPGPTCYVGFIGDLRKVIDDVPEANDFFLMIHGFSEVAQKGTADVLKHAGADRFYRMFDELDALRGSPNRMPFAKNEDLFEVVGRMGELVDSGHPIPGLTSVVGSLAGVPPQPQGAVFSLFIARDIAADGGSYAAVQAFEVTFNAAGRARRYDVVSTNGIRHENKNWSDGIQLGSGAFTEFMSEFRADIILEAAAETPAFSRTRYNFNASVAREPDGTELLANLLQQFDHPEITSLLSDLQRDALKKAFEAKWRSGDIVRYYAF